MKVLLVHNAYAEYSGEESVLDDTISILSKNNHEVIKYFRGSQEVYNNKFGKYVAFFAGVYNPKSRKTFNDILSKEKPDVIHIHNLFPLISPSILPIAKKHQIPIVMTVHNFRLICPNGLYYTNDTICEKCNGGKEYMCVINNCEKNYAKSLGYAIRNWWARVAGYYTDNIEQFLCLTRFQAQKLIDQGFDNNKIKIIPNMINDSLGYRKQEKSSGESVLYVGRISDEKGIKTLLKVAIRNPDITFKIAGLVPDGYFANDNIPKNFVLLGFCNKNELSQLYDDCSFLVFPSICYEGFPTVIAEAMLHQKAIVCSKIGGLSEIVENNHTGLLFSPGNDVDLEQSIRTLLYNETLCKELGVNGRQKALRNYSKETYYENLISAYESAIENYQKS